MKAILDESKPSLRLTGLSLLPCQTIPPELHHDEVAIETLLHSGAHVMLQSSLKCQPNATNAPFPCPWPHALPLSGNKVPFTLNILAVIVAVYPSIALL